MQWVYLCDVRVSCECLQPADLYGDALLDEAVLAEQGAQGRADGGVAAVHRADGGQLRQRQRMGGGREGGRRGGGGGGGGEEAERWTKEEGKEVAVRGVQERWSCTPHRSAPRGAHCGA